MGDGLAFFDIIFFALVAGFLILRLRSVLGRRTGNENRERWTPRLPQREPVQPRAPERPVSVGDNVTPLPNRGAAAAAPSSTLDASLTQIKVADPSFDPDHFLTGARSAFEMIVTAYAQGDTATLRPLLADDVYENFAA